MQRLLLIFVTVFLSSIASQSATAVAAEMRFALVIGNASYKANPLATPINDAGVIAQALGETGFLVTAQHDLDEGNLRKAFSDFAATISKAGPDVIVVVYFAGNGLQLRGENYLLPVDADMATADNARARAISFSDQMHSLAALHPKASLLILDEARTNPSSWSSSPPAGGFAWVEPEPDMLIAFNAGPGTVVREGRDSLGPYAKALAEMIRGDSQTPVELFERVRLRVNQLTIGAQVPWSASKIQAQFVLFPRNSGAPASTDWRATTTTMRAQPLQKIGMRDAYFVTLLRDTLDGYADFLAAYWQDPMANRVQALLAARREAITWWRSYQRNVPEAYWTYLERYPNGPHTIDARDLLNQLGASNVPPSKFARLEYDVPPPLPDELPYIERPGLLLDDAQFAFASPPPLPVIPLGPQPQQSDIAKSSAALPPIGGAFIAPSTEAIIGRAVPPLGLLAPSSLESGLEVRGTIGGPIRPSDKFTTPPNPDVTSDVTKAKPLQENKAPSHSPETPGVTQQLVDQPSTNPNTEPRELAGKTPDIAPVTASTPGAAVPSEVQDEAHRALSATHPPVHLRRSTNMPAVVSGAIGGRPRSAGQPLPSPGSVPSPGSKPVDSVRSPSNAQPKPAVRSAPGRLPNQSVSTVATPTTRPKAVGIQTAKPNLTTRHPEAACSDLDGRQTCR
jgi:uncharacterized caspase-like protein